MKTLIQTLSLVAQGVAKAGNGNESAHPAKPIVDLGPGSMPGHFWA